MAKHESKSDRSAKDSGHRPTHGRDQADNGLNRTLNRLEAESKEPIPGLGGTDNRGGKHSK